MYTAQAYTHTTFIHVQIWHFFAHVWRRCSSTNKVVKRCLYFSLNFRRKHDIQEMTISLLHAHTHIRVPWLHEHVVVQKCKTANITYSLNVWIYATKLYFVRHSNSFYPLMQLGNWKTSAGFGCWWWFLFHFEKKTEVDISRHPPGIEHLLVFPISALFLYTHL